MILATMEAATTVFPLAAIRVSGQGEELTRNSHLGFGWPTTTLHPAPTIANSNTASGLRGPLCDEGRRSRTTGKERDSETGLDYFGARYFLGEQGRFTSPDEPLNDQNPSDPQSWNLYSYVRNNPLRFTDLTGRDCVQTDSHDSYVGVTVTSGQCGSDGGTFVNGTVNVDSLSYDRQSNSLGYSFADAAAGTGGAGSIGLPAPVEFPGNEGAANRAGAARIGASQLFINEFAKQAAHQAIGGVAGHFIGAGIDAALAARAAAAATDSVQFGKRKSNLPRVSTSAKKQA